MKHFFPFLISVFFIQSCDDKPVAAIEKPSTYGEPYDTVYSIDTDGYMEDGQIITQWDCPDSKFFPPIDLTAWYKTSVVNGRLPTYRETLNGSAIHTYRGNKSHGGVKLYDIALPKLAYFKRRIPKLIYRGHLKPVFSSTETVLDSEIVVVIQIVQTIRDTIVGYRYLTGGVGGSLFHDFRFLSDDEVSQAVFEWRNMKININPNKNKC
jgi:hypothetical protein